MKAQRKEFQHPAGHFTEQAQLFNWGWGKKKDWVAESLQEVRQKVQDFLTNLGPEKVISVNEYVGKKHRNGDDGITHFVVWYWEED